MGRSDEPLAVALDHVQGEGIIGLGQSPLGGVGVGPGVGAHTLGHHLDLFGSESLVGPELVVGTRKRHAVVGIEDLLIGTVIPQARDGEVSTVEGELTAVPLAGLVPAERGDGDVTVVAPFPRRLAAVVGEHDGEVVIEHGGLHRIEGADDAQPVTFGDFPEELGGGVRRRCGPVRVDHDVGVAVPTGGIEGELGGGVGNGDIPAALALHRHQRKLVDRLGVVSVELIGSKIAQVVAHGEVVEVDAHLHAGDLHQRGGVAQHGLFVVELGRVALDVGAFEVVEVDLTLHQADAADLVEVRGHVLEGQVPLARVEGLGSADGVFVVDGGHEFLDCLEGGVGASGAGVAHRAVAERSAGDDAGEAETEGDPLPPRCRGGCRGGGGVELVEGGDFRSGVLVCVEHDLKTPPPHGADDTGGAKTSAVVPVSPVRVYRAAMMGA